MPTRTRGTARDGARGAGEGVVEVPFARGIGPRPGPARPGPARPSGSGVLVAGTWTTMRTSRTAVRAAHRSWGTVMPLHSGAAARDARARARARALACWGTEGAGGLAISDLAPSRMPALLPLFTFGNELVCVCKDWLCRIMGEGLG